MLVGNTAVDVLVYAAAVGREDDLVRVEAARRAGALLEASAEAVPCAHRYRHDGRWLGRAGRACRWGGDADGRASNNEESGHGSCRCEQGKRNRSLHRHHLPCFTRAQLGSGRYLPWSCGTTTVAEASPVFPATSWTLTWIV
jgi:hypothetical protein